MKTGESGFGIIFDVDGTMVNNTAYHRPAWTMECGDSGVFDSGGDKFQAAGGRFVVFFAACRSKFCGKTAFECPQQL